jgi:glucokinase
VSVVGIDVGGTKIASAVVGRDGAVSLQASRPTPTNGRELLDVLVEVIDHYRREGADRPEAIGVGLPSLIQQPAGIVEVTANIDLAGVPVRDELTRRTGLPIALDNDGNLAALAEHRIGAGRGHDDMILIAVGTGVGGGIISAGQLVRGGRGTGAEVGHMVVQADGPRCQRNCPNRGCLETMASGTAIARDAGMPAPEVVERARSGDPEAHAVLAKAGGYLGVGIANLANLFAPSLFAIGGGVGAAGDLLLAPAEREYRSRALPPNARAEVVPAELGNTAGVVGAGLLAWDRVDAGG